MVQFPIGRIMHMRYSMELYLHTPQHTFHSTPQHKYYLEAKPTPLETTSSTTLIESTAFKAAVLSRVGIHNVQHRIRAQSWCSAQ